MDDVTDSVFRRIVSSCAKPDVFITEFVSVEGLVSDGKDRLLPKLYFTKEERPIIAQVWGKTPEYFYTMAKDIMAMGFDGIDINMGCPDKTVMKNGGGAACILDPIRAGEIIEAVKKGAGRLPVSVKTRIGVKSIQTEEWIGFLLSRNVDTLTIHGRTAKELSDVPARWEELGKVVKLRNQMKKQTVIIGNGDVMTIARGKQLVEEYGVDGVMIGRGVFADPWVFDPTPHKHTTRELLQLLVRHLTLFQKSGTKKRHYPMMKKYFKMYVRDFEGASALREKLIETENEDLALKIINDFTDFTSGVKDYLHLGK